MNSHYQKTDIETLKEILGSLNITKKYTWDENKTIELEIPVENMLVVLASAVIVQAVTLKSIVPEPG